MDDDYAEMKKDGDFISTGSECDSDLEEGAQGGEENSTDDEELQRDEQEVLAQFGIIAQNSHSVVKQ